MQRSIQGIFQDCQKLIGSPFGITDLRTVFTALSFATLHTVGSEDTSVAVIESLDPWPAFDNGLNVENYKIDK